MSATTLLPLGTLMPSGTDITSELGKVLPPGPGTVFSMISAFSKGNVTARIVTGLLGVLLIAAAIFTHPTVINVGKKAARVAGEAAAAA